MASTGPVGATMAAMQPSAGLHTAAAKEDLRSRILITSGTSQVGSNLIHILATKYNDRFHVTAGLCSTSAKLKHSEIWEGADRALIMTLEKGEKGSDSSVSLAGIEMMVLIPDSSQHRVEHAQALVDAAVKAGVQYILLISGIHDPTAPSARVADFSAQFQHIECLVTASRLPYTVLRCGFFQQNFFLHATEICRGNTISLPLKNGRIAPLNVLDVAKAAAAISNHPSQHIGSIYNLLGPELLTAEDIAIAARDGLGRSIRVVTISPEEYHRLLVRDGGLEGWQADGLLDMMQQAREDHFRSLFSQTFFKTVTDESGVRLVDFFRMNREAFEPVTGEEEGAKASASASAAGVKDRDVPEQFASQPASQPAPQLAPQQPDVMPGKQNLAGMAMPSAHEEVHPKQAREQEDVLKEGGRGKPEDTTPSRAPPAVGVQYHEFIQAIQAVTTLHHSCPSAENAHPRSEYAQALGRLDSVCKSVCNAHPEVLRQLGTACPQHPGLAGYSEARQRADSEVARNEGDTKHEHRQSHKIAAGDELASGKGQQHWRDEGGHVIAAQAPESYQTQPSAHSARGSMPADELRYSVPGAHEEHHHRRETFVGRATKKVASALGLRHEPREEHVIEATTSGPTLVYADVHAVSESSRVL